MCLIVVMLVGSALSCPPYFAEMSFQVPISLFSAFGSSPRAVLAKNTIVSATEQARRELLRMIWALERNERITGRGTSIAAFYPPAKLPRQNDRRNFRSADRVTLCNDAAKSGVPI